MKVKIFTEHDEPRYSNGNCIVSLEKRINNFIKNKRVIDIKYQISDTEDSISGFSERALVIYEDQQDLSSYKFIDVIDDESEDKKCPYCDLKNDLYKRSFLDTRGISANGPYYMSIVHDFIDTHFVIMSELPSGNKASNGQGNSILIHYCPMCGRKMTLSNVFKETSGRISWKFVCHYCNTVTQFYDEATEKGEDTMTKNGRTYENIDELNKALKKINSSLQVRRSFGYLLSIDLFSDDTLAVIKCPDSNHLDGYWFQWVAKTDGNRRTSEIIKSVMGVVNNLLAQFDTYTHEGFFDHDDKD